MGGTLTLAAVALACFATYTHAQQAPSPNNTLINWETCTDNELIQCGFFSVPLDYTNSSAGNATLAVSRYKSTNATRLGTLFTNPGGPGGSGTQLVQGGLGQLISELTLGQYDVVSWDPRGVNLSTPAITCGFNSADDVNSFFHSLPLTVGVEAHGNFTDQSDIDNLFNQVNETDADLVAFGQKCDESDGAFLKFMGTTSTVRDMVSLSDYLEGPGQKLNYWGFSYGTVIGNYFVTMFPDRVGRVILDGVVDTNVWSTQPSFNMWASSLGSVEDTFLGFATTCAQAGPQGCAIAEANSTGASVAQFVRDLIDTAYELGKENIQNISSTTMRLELLNEGDPGLFQPTTWVDLALLMAANATQFANLTATSGSPPSRLRTRDNSGPFSNITSSPVNSALSLFAISCLDSIDQDNVTTKDVFDELLRVSQEESPTFGELMPHDASFYCHRFPVRAVERLTGPFNNTPAFPIVVIGNQADPVTPFANAKAVAAQYGDHARLIEQDDFGHASVAERSDCTRGVISDYFLTGALPMEGEVCGTNQVLFPGPGITKSTMDGAASGNADSQTNIGNNSPQASPDTNMNTDVASNVEGALGTDNNTDSDEVHNLTMQRNILLGVAGGLALASLVLAASLVFSCLRNRRNARYASPMAASARVTRHDAFDGRNSLDGEVQPYSDPWEGKKAAY